MIEFIILISAIANISLGSLVFYKKPNSASARAFFVFSIAATLWIITNLLWWINFEYIWFKLTYITGIVFVVTGLIWTHYVSRIKFPLYYIGIYCISAFFALFSLFDNAIVVKFPAGYIASSNDFNLITEGPLFDAFGVYLFCMLVFILFRFTQGWYRASGLLRVQIGYITIAAWIFLGIVIITDTVIPLVSGSFRIAFVDSPASLILIGVTAYVTLKYRLMDVQILMRRGFIYGTLALFSYGVFHLIAWSFIKIFGNLWTFPAMMTGLILSFVFVIILPQAKKAVIYVANNFLYANIYNAQEAWQKLTDQVVTLTDLSTLAKTVITTINKTFEVRRVMLAVMSGSKCRIIRQKGFTRPQVKKLKKDFTYLNNLSKIILATDLDHERQQQSYNLNQRISLVSLFSHSNLQLIAPLRIKGMGLGFILLGPKRANRLFTKEDIRLLDTFTKQASIAIYNDILYSDAKAKNLRLRRLLRLKGEFLTLASHQLRTPVSIIRWSSASLLDSKSTSNRPKTLKALHESSVRLSKLISDMLIASQSETKEFVIKNRELESVNVFSLVHEVVSDLQAIIEKKDVRLDFQVSRAINVLAHKRYLRLVLENMIDNAIKYTPDNQPDSKIVITAKSVAVLNVNKIKLSVIDEGVGISTKDQSKIFDKFVRLDNALFSVTDGTGLGLYIVKKIIGAHPGGEYGVISKLGKGSEFWVELLAGSKK